MVTEIQISKPRTNFIALDNNKNTVNEATTVQALVNKLKRKGVSTSEVSFMWIPKRNRHYHFCYT